MEASVYSKTKVCVEECVMDGSVVKGGSTGFFGEENCVRENGSAKLCFSERGVVPTFENINVLLCIFLSGRTVVVKLASFLAVELRP